MQPTESTRLFGVLPTLPGSLKWSFVSHEIFTGRDLHFPLDRGAIVPDEVGKWASGPEQTVILRRCGLPGSAGARAARRATRPAIPFVDSPG